MFYSGTDMRVFDDLDIILVTVHFSFPLLSFPWPWPSPDVDGDISKAFKLHEAQLI